ncbi:MAG: type VI secretion system secreted protein Hcp [Pseudoalteromonas tetraodonis]|jgi:type VI secretion system secreted protein Hcp
MKINSISNHIRKIIALAVGIGLTFALPLTADAASYLKFDGIDGEAQDERHEKWIDVLSVDWAIEKSSAEGATGATRRVVVKDIVVTHELDKASPKLQEACLTGAIIPGVELELTRLFDNQSNPTYLKYELTNVRVTSIRMQADASGGDSTPKMLITLNFEEIKVTYTQLDTDGNEVATSSTYLKIGDISGE